MPISLNPWLGLISIVLFFLPGFAGIKLGLRKAGRGDWLNRLETIGLSFGLSLSAMLGLYLIGSGIHSYDQEDIILLSRTTIINWLSTLPSIILWYLLLVGLALAGGLVLGHYDFGGSYFEPILPWERFHQLAEHSGEDETYVVRVRTLAGDELRGKVEDEGEAALNKDIILEDPRRLRFAETGEIADQTSWTGNAYIHSQSIAHVEFDRLEDADAAQAQEYERQSQQTLEDASEAEADEEEMEELEELAQESEANGQEDDRQDS